MTDEELRQALDDSVLAHTGRSLGDLASQRVIDDIWSLIAAREAALVAITRAVARFDDDDASDGSYKCHWCAAMYDDVGGVPAPHAAECPVTKARALLGRENEVDDDG